MESAQIDIKPIPPFNFEGTIYVPHCYPTRARVGVAEMGEKRLTSIRINGEVIDKAKEAGLNISKTRENALKEAIKRLQTPFPQTETNGGYTDTRSVSRSARLAGPRECSRYSGRILTSQVSSFFQIFLALFLTGRPYESRN